MDLPKHDRYDYSALPSRADYSWPGGKRLAVAVCNNIEIFGFLSGLGADHTVPGAPQSTRNYAWRDYGNRVGHIRQMEVLEKYGVRGSISLSTALCDHHPEIIAMCAERNWEFFSHGIYNTRYTYGMSEEQEREMIRDSMATINKQYPKV